MTRLLALLAYLIIFCINIVDSEGTIFDTPVDIYDEPYPYYDNGTFVEINGDEMIFKQKGYNDVVYVTVFRRINP